MNKTVTTALLTAACGAALCGVFTSGASAQSAAAAEKPITIKLGAFFPSGSRLKDGVRDTWFSAGAEYALPTKAGAATSNLSYLGYIDYAGSDHRGIKASYVGVGPGVRYLLQAPGSESTLTPYVGAGIGAYFLHGSGLGGSSNKTNFGYRLNAGVEFKRAYLFEVNYTDANSLSGARFSGFNIQLGAKF